MSKKTFNYTDVIGYGWDVMGSNLGYFIGVGMLYLVAMYLSAVVEYIIRLQGVAEPVMSMLSISLTLLGQIIGMILAIGMIKIGLIFCDEQKPYVATLFDVFGCFWRYFGFVMLYALIILSGVIFFIVPGIIFAVKFCLGFYFVIDRGFGPIEALKASSKATRGVMWELFGFQIFCGLIIYAGILCLGLGLFAAYPTVVVAKALVYRQLAAQTFDFQRIEMEQ